MNCRATLNGTLPLSQGPAVLPSHRSTSPSSGLLPGALGLSGAAPDRVRHDSARCHARQTEALVAGTLQEAVQVPTALGPRIRQGPFVMHLWGFFCLNPTTTGGVACVPRDMGVWYQSVLDQLWGCCQLNSKTYTGTNWGPVMSWISCGYTRCPTETCARHCHSSLVTARPAGALALSR